MRKSYPHSLSSRKSQKRNKSGLLPGLYSSLSLEEKQAVKTAMTFYNSSSGSYFLEPEQFYQNVYRGSLTIPNKFSNKPLKNAKLPMMETKI
jgi:hypothetical protein